jgi:hypothetical protein
VTSRAVTLSAWARGHRSIIAGAALVLLWLGASVVLAAWFSGRIRDWSVMTDEMLYAKLATSIADTKSPLPSVNGASISVYNQLYPLLIAPLYGALSAPDAFRAAHVLNAFVMASAAFPAYLLGRQVLDRVWSFAVALLSVLVPWMILTGFVMTEVAAYPAFLWAILGLQVAMADPSPRRDLLAVGALGLAVLARTQFAALVVVLPLAILGLELGQALTGPSTGSRRRRLLDGAREALRRHRVLAVVYALGVVLAAIVAVVGSAGSLLGVYGVTIEEGSPLPLDAWPSAARHLDAVGIGCGLAPLILGGGWILANVVRPHSRREHAFATLALLTIVVLTLEVASFGVRFGDDTVRERYLFYVVPLLLVGMAAALAGAGAASRRLVAACSGAVAIFFAATAGLLPFTTFAGVLVDSPAGVLNELLRDQSGALGTKTFVALLGVFLGLVLVLGLLFAPRLPFALIVVAALLVFSTLTLRSQVDRIVGDTGLSTRPLAGDPGLVLDWVDTVVPAGAEAAIVPFPISTAWDTTAIRWWDVQFWNRRITRDFSAEDGNWSYTPFPRDALEIDWETGEVAGTADAPRYTVSAPHDPRFGLAGRTEAMNLGFVVRSADRPYRALWASRGLEPDGWTRPGRPAAIRVFGGRGGRPELATLRVNVRAPDTASARYLLSSGSRGRAGELAAGAEQAVSLPVCIAPRQPADATIRSPSSAPVDGLPLGPGDRGTRRVGVLVGPIEVERSGRPC